MRALAVALLLAACAGPPTPLPEQPAEPPTELRVCPDGVAPPAAPQPPRTIEQVAAWATAVEHARIATETARRTCADRLARLQSWVSQRQQE